MTPRDRATPPAAYGLTKLGMKLFARRQVIRWRAREARIVSLSPGIIATPFGSIEFGKSVGKRALYGEEPALPRMLDAGNRRRGRIPRLAENILHHRHGLLVDGGVVAAVMEG